MSDRRAYMKQYYLDHREERIAYSAAYFSTHGDEEREKDARQQRWFLGNLNILRAAQGCYDCATHGGSLLHHHVDPSTKKYSVSQMYNNSLEALLNEIAKCTVLCVPCHSLRHAALRANARAAA